MTCAWKGSFWLPSVCVCIGQVHEKTVATIQAAWIRVVVVCASGKEVIGFWVYFIGVNRVCRWT